MPRSLLGVRGTQKSCCLVPALRALIGRRHSREPWAARPCKGAVAIMCMSVTTSASREGHSATGGWPEPPTFSRGCNVSTSQTVLRFELPLLTSLAFCLLVLARNDTNRAARILSRVSARRGPQGQQGSGHSAAWVAFLYDNTASGLVGEGDLT